MLVLIVFVTLQETYEKDKLDLYLASLHVEMEMIKICRGRLSA